MEVLRKRVLAMCLALTLASLFVFVTIVCPVKHCGIVTYPDNVRDKQTELPKSPRISKVTRRLAAHAFDVSNNDIMVVLHIQKTGGTVFGKHLVHDLVLERPCEYSGHDNIYECKRPVSNQIWLYSRFSTGWICGPHAGWTELTSCIPRVLRTKRIQPRLNRIFYVTWLRDPVQRFLSEFGHVRRGATWKTARHFCNGKQYSVPPCYKGDEWSNVTLDEFTNCPYNLAINRQTRMVADLNALGCYRDVVFNSSEADKKALLRNAKKNLNNFAFIGLVEYQKESQFLFEKTFGVKFSRPFEQKPKQWAKKALVAFNSTKLMKKVHRLNKLDIQLYEYAKELFFHRLQFFKNQ